MKNKKRFFVFRHRDAADAYIKALLKAGYLETGDVSNADFVLYDHELRLPTAILDRPTFIFPHTPYSWFIWDGLCPVYPAACNFVAGENAKAGLGLLNYPNRVEVCGFPRCKVMPFRPSLGKRLLFAPAHPLKDGRYPNEEDYLTHGLVYDWIVWHAKYFDSVTVRIMGTPEENGFQKEDGIVFENAAVSSRYSAALTAADSVASIERNDIIISCNTFGYLALARGKPTILYGNTNPRTREGSAKRYHLYRHLIDFPLQFEDLSIDEVIKAGSIMNPIVEDWRQKTIGANFDSEKFISVIMEHV